MRYATFVSLLILLLCSGVSADDQAPAEAGSAKVLDRIADLEDQLDELAHALRLMAQAQGIVPPDADPDADDETRELTDEEAQALGVVDASDAPTRGWKKKKWVRKAKRYARTQPKPVRKKKNKKSGGLLEDGIKIVEKEGGKAAGSVADLGKTATGEIAKGATWTADQITQGVNEVKKVAEAGAKAFEKAVKDLAKFLKKMLDPLEPYYAYCDHIAKAAVDMKKLPELKQLMTALKNGDVAEAARLALIIRTKIGFTSPGSEPGSLTFELAVGGGAGVSGGGSTGVAVDLRDRDVRGFVTYSIGVGAEFGGGAEGVVGWTPDRAKDVDGKTIDFGVSLKGGVGVSGTISFSTKGGHQWWELQKHFDGIAVGLGAGAEVNAGSVLYTVTEFVRSGTPNDGSGGRSSGTMHRWDTPTDPATRRSTSSVPTPRQRRMGGGLGGSVYGAGGFRGIEDDPTELKDFAASELAGLYVNAKGQRFGVSKRRPLRHKRAWLIERGLKGYLVYTTKLESADGVVKGELWMHPISGAGFLMQGDEVRRIAVLTEAEITFAEERFMPAHEAQADFLGQRITHRVPAGTVEIWESFQATEK